MFNRASPIHVLKIYINVIFTYGQETTPNDIANKYFQFIFCLILPGRVPNFASTTVDDVRFFPCFPTLLNTTK